MPETQQIMTSIDEFSGGKFKTGQMKFNHLYKNYSNWKKQRE